MRKIKPRAGNCFSLAEYVDSKFVLRRCTKTRVWISLCKRFSSELKQFVQDSMAKARSKEGAKGGKRGKERESSVVG